MKATSRILAIGERCPKGDANFTLPTTAVDHKRSVHGLLAYIHLRLDEIFRRDQWCGGVNVLFVGAPTCQLGTGKMTSKAVAQKLGCMTSINSFCAKMENSSEENCGPLSEISTSGTPYLENIALRALEIPEVFALVMFSTSMKLL